MYKINYNKIKVLYIIPVLLFIFLIPFFITPFLFDSFMEIGSEKFDSSAEATFLRQDCHHDGETGNIMCSNIYQYEVDNIKYTCGHNYSFNAGREMKLKENKIYYDSSNPQDCMVKYDESNLIFGFLPFLIPFLLFGICIIIYIKRKIKRLKQLEITGTLINNLTYSLEKISSKNNVLVPVVYYKLPYGETVKLIGEQHEPKVYKENPTIQLLIDMNNPKNYYLDFDILK